MKLKNETKQNKKHYFLTRGCKFNSYSEQYISFYFLFNNKDFKKTFLCIVQNNDTETFALNK